MQVEPSRKIQRTSNQPASIVKQGTSTPKIGCFALKPQNSWLVIRYKLGFPTMYCDHPQYVAQICIVIPIINQLAILNTAQLGNPHPCIFSGSSPNFCRARNSGRPSPLLEGGKGRQPNLGDQVPITHQIPSVSVPSEWSLIDPMKDRWNISDLLLSTSYIYDPPCPCGHHVYRSHGQ